MENLINSEIRTNFLNLSTTRIAFLLFTFHLLSFAFGVYAQDLPDEIRGYKVQKAKISVTNKADKPVEKDQSNEKNKSNEKDKSNQKDKSEAFARLTEPELVETDLTGLTFEISAEIDALDYKGKIDFLTFMDFKVNGLDVEIAEYTNSFEFKKNELIKLPKPVKIFLGTAQAIKGALSEVSNSKEEWTVTGKVFVFGRFKKFGFDFKRVVPVEVSVKIKNPLKKENILSAAYPSF